MNEYRPAIDETRVIGREISQRTFGGKKLDYKIPTLEDVSTSIDKVQSSLMSHLSSYDDIALLLSGGKDSRLLGVILKKLGKKVKCYTYKARHNRYENNELKVAQNVAKKLGFEHDTIPIDWYRYYNRDSVERIMKVTDGVPVFYNILTMNYIREKIPEKNLITGDLITELWDTMEYRPWKNRKPLKDVLFDRERLIIKSLLDVPPVEKLKTLYKNTDEKKILLLVKSDRLVRKQVYEKLGWNVIHPALFPETLNLVLSLPLGERTDGVLTRTIIKNNNIKLYKYRTARSPFSLRFPLSCHIAYGKIFGTGVSNTPIRGSFDDEVKQIENKMERYREDNYRWWKYVNKK